MAVRRPWASCLIHGGHGYCHICLPAPSLFFFSSFSSLPLASLWEAVKFSLNDSSVCSFLFANGKALRSSWTVVELHFLHKNQISTRLPEAIALSDKQLSAFRLHYKLYFQFFLPLFLNSQGSPHREHVFSTKVCQIEIEWAKGLPLLVALG